MCNVFYALSTEYNDLRELRSILEPLETPLESGILCNEP